MSRGLTGAGEGLGAEWGLGRSQVLQVQAGCSLTPLGSGKPPGLPALLLQALDIPCPALLCTAQPLGPAPTSGQGLPPQLCHHHLEAQLLLWSLWQRVPR